MKKRKFYPRQVLRRLHGEHSNLSEVQIRTLEYLLRRSRKLGVAVSVVQPVSEYKKMSSEFVGNVFKNCTTKILLRPLI